MCNASSLSEIVPALLWCEQVADFTDGFPEIVVGSGLHLSQKGLELRKGHFDRIVVWRVSRQEEYPRLSFGDGSRRSGALVDVEVIPDHHVARLKRRRELGSHVGVELVAIHGSIDDKGGDDGIAAQTGDEGLGVPFAKGRIRLQALAPSAPATQRCHVGLDRSLVHEDEAPGALLHGGLTTFAPLIALPAHIGAFAFRCQQRFF